jgi:KaiC/GvpD/RAD55 family RecA-like ATPase
MAKRGRPKKEHKKKTVAVSLDPKLHEFYKSVAAITGVSFSEFVEDNLKQYLEDISLKTREQFNVPEEVSDEELTKRVQTIFKKVSEEVLKEVI